MIRMLFILSFVLCFSCPAQSQTVGSITSRDMEGYCSAPIGTPEKTACILLVKGFMDGFIEGVGAGIMGVYRYDPDVYALVKDIKMSALMPQTLAVSKKATCISTVSIDAFIGAFISYARSHPELSDTNYRQAMIRTIQTTFCH